MYNDEKYPIVFLTKRTIVREHTATDAKSLYRLLSNPVAMTYIQDLYVSNVEGACENLNFAIQAISQCPRKHFFWAILEKESKNYIGEFGFTVIQASEKGNVLEMGYFILPEYWGKGITSEVACEGVHYAFTHLNVHKITTGCVKANTASEAIMIKLNMKKEGELRSHYYHDGRWLERVIYGLTCEEYTKTAMR